LDEVPSGRFEKRAEEREFFYMEESVALCVFHEKERMKQNGEYKRK
jgi:hypothetical protein